MTRKYQLPNIDFKPDSIDIFKKHDKFKGSNGKTVYDAVQGCNRLISDARYISQQISSIDRCQAKNPGKRVRHLTLMPENHNNYDALRSALNNIELSAGLPDRFISMEKSETLQDIQRYARTLPSEQVLNNVLVLDDNMNYRNFAPAVYFGLKNFNEIVIIYSDWEKNWTKYKFLVGLPDADRQKIHFTELLLSINKFSHERLFATVLVSQRFKSVNFKDPEIPLFIKSKLGGRPIKTQSQKLGSGIWIDGTSMDYGTNHPTNCACLNGAQITNIGVDNCIVHHDLELLSREFKQILSDPLARKRVLQLPSLQPIIQKLGITP